MTLSCIIMLGTCFTTHIIAQWRERTNRIWYRNEFRLSLDRNQAKLDDIKKHQADDSITTCFWSTNG